MRIVLDVDGVLANFVGSALEIINALSGDQFWEGNVTMWNMEALLPPELRPAFFWHVEQPGFVERMEPLRGETHVARELMRRGHDVVFATSPWKTSPHWEQERRSWLAREFGRNVEVHSVADKSPVSGDVFVDDKPIHVQQWQAANPTGRAFLFDATYNRAVYGCNRISSLRELL